MELIEPAVTPPLDQGFRPAVLANHAFQSAGPIRWGAGSHSGLERSGGEFSRYSETSIPEDHPDFNTNLHLHRAHL